MASQGGAGRAMALAAVAIPVEGAVFHRTDGRNAHRGRRGPAAWPSGKKTGRQPQVRPGLRRLSAVLRATGPVVRAGIEPGKGDAGREEGACWRALAGARGGFRL